VTLRAAVGEVRFAGVSGLARSGPGRFEGSVSAEWTIAGKPNGGYMLAMLGRAAAAVSAHQHVIAASAHFLRSPAPGSVSVEAHVLRGGRSASQGRASMYQDGEICVEALVTTADLEPTGTPFWDRGVPARSDVAFEDCVRMVPILPDGGRVAMLEHAEVRLEPGCAGFLSGRPSGNGELRGWIALPGGEAFDATSLLFAVDSFPPASFDVEFAGWVPTLELTAYVRALPAPGPVRILQRARLIDGGRLDESCFVWDRTGRLVAEGSQLAAIRLG
jgi:Thioesterase-like superfamily